MATTKTPVTLESEFLFLDNHPSSAPIGYTRKKNLLALLQQAMRDRDAAAFAEQRIAEKDATIDRLLQQVQALGGFSPDAP